jgi:hypothetical protein
MSSFEQFFAALGEVPNQFSYWIRTANDTTFLSIMFVATLLLTFVIARALR